MRSRFVGKRVLAVAILGFTATATLAGDSSDKLTALPINPGMFFSQKVGSPVCGKEVEMNLYFRRSTQPQ